MLKHEFYYSRYWWWWLLAVKDIPIYFKLIHWHRVYLNVILDWSFIIKGLVSRAAQKHFSSNLFLEFNFFKEKFTVYIHYTLSHIGRNLILDNLVSHFPYQRQNPSKLLMFLGPII